MSNWHEGPPTPAEVDAFMSNLTFDKDAEVDESTLPPPGAPIKVVRSVRIPYEVNEHLEAVAAERGISASLLACQFIEAALEALDQPGQAMVPLEAIRKAIEDALSHVPRIAA